MSVTLVKNLSYHLVSLQITESDPMIKELVDLPHIFVAFLMVFSVKDTMLFSVYSKLYLKLGLVVGTLVLYKENKSSKCIFVVICP